VKVFAIPLQKAGALLSKAGVKRAVEATQRRAWIKPDRRTMRD
jgi:hypothetical protein